MKHSVRIFFIVFWFLLVGLGIFGLWLSEQYVVPIMMYHSVNYEEGRVANTIHPSNFERHMAYLKKRKYNVISLEELVSLTEANKPLPRRSVVITFDDGYEDNYTYAFEVLKRFGFPATIFVITGQVQKDGYLTWKQLREMEEYNITIGSHTQTHAYLPGLEEEAQFEELHGSKRILEKKLGHAVKFLCYPTGGFSDPIKKMARDMGYKGAVTTNRSSSSADFHRLNRDVYELKRIRFGDEDNSRVILFIKLSGFYNAFRKLKSPY